MRHGRTAGLRRFTPAAPGPVRSEKILRAHAISLRAGAPYPAEMIRLLALSGSLRARSSNAALLGAAVLLAPDTLRVEAFEGIGDLPHFNPDLESEALPPVVNAFRRRIGEADGLLISCPEYARGIPGSFKNALDWLVGSLDFPGKPVALFNASPRASDAQAALRLVLATMSARLIAEADLTLPLLAKGLEAHAIAADPVLADPIRAALAAFAAAVEP